MKSFTSIALALSNVVALSACGTPPNPLMGSGHTPEYAAGFNDGCSSGRASQDVAAGFYTKNVNRFDTDQQYAAGWNAGYSKCANNQMQEDAYGGGRR